MSDNFGFPQRSASQEQGIAGEAFFNFFVKGRLRWDYFQVPRESDFGIDGHIVPVINGVVSGRSISAQVKCGRTYLAKKTTGGIRYEGENRHINYLLHQRSPVVLVVINEDFSEGYWEIFHMEKTAPAGKNGWWLEIPIRNKIDLSVGDQWNRLAGPADDHTEMVRRFWAISKLIEDAGLISLAIPADEVKARSMDTVWHIIKQLSRNSDLLIKKKFSLELFFPDYIDDPRELYEIPEIREWFKVSLFLDDVPWFYFLNTKKPHPGLTLLWLCANPIDIKKREGGMVYTEFNTSTPEPRKWINRNYENLNRFTENHGLPEELNKQASLAPVAALTGQWEKPNRG